MFTQWIEELHHNDAAIRLNAAQKLGDAKDERAVQPLIQKLEDTNAKVQYAVFAALVKLSASQAAPHMIELLYNNRNSKLWGLLKLGIGLRLRAGLLGLIASGDTPLANRLIQILDDQTLELEERAFFARMWGRTQDPRAVEVMIDTLQNHPEVMQGAAAEALGYLGDIRAIDTLIASLQTVDSDQIREVCAESLGRLGDEKAVDALIMALKDENEWVRRAAAVALGDLGHARAVEPLSNHLHDESQLVQDAVFDALKKLSTGSFNTIL